MRIKQCVLQQLLHSYLLIGFENFFCIKNLTKPRSHPISLDAMKFTIKYLKNLKSPWSDATRWLMDLLQSVILWTLGIIVTITYLNKKEREANYISFKNQTYFTMGSATIDRLRSAGDRFYAQTLQRIGKRDSSMTENVIYVETVLLGYEQALGSFESIFCKPNSPLYDPTISVKIDSLAILKKSFSDPKPGQELKYAFRCAKFKRQKDHIINLAENKLRDINFTQ